MTSTEGGISRFEYHVVTLGIALASLAVAGRLHIEDGRRDPRGDTRYYVVWGEQAREVGVLGLYSISNEQSQQRWGRHGMNYGPAYAYCVWGQDALRRALFGEVEYYHSGVLLILLLPQALAYVLAGVVLMALVRRRGGPRTGAWAGLLFFLSPGILAVSPWKGQTDALITLVLFASLAAALAGRWATVGAVWMLGLLVKPQPILLAPVLACILWRQRTWANLLRAAIGAAVVLAVVAGPFGVANTGAERFAWFRKPYVDSFAIWNHTTNKAYNLWWIDRAITGVGDPAAAILGVPRSAWGQGMLAAAAMLAVAAMIRRRRADLAACSAAAAVIAIAAFLLPTRVWDRYLGYGLALMIPLALTDRVALAAYVVMNVTWILNLFTSVHDRLVAAGRPVPDVQLTGILCAAITLACFVVLVVRAFRRVPWLAAPAATTMSPPPR